MPCQGVSKEGNPLPSGMNRMCRVTRIIIPHKNHSEEGLALNFRHVLRDLMHRNGNSVSQFGICICHLARGVCVLSADYIFFYNMSEKTVIESLIKSDVFRIGEFTLRSGASSPIYIDLRTIISYPDIIKGLADLVHSKQLQAALKPDVICGVPYTALPIASVYSVAYNIPMVMKRKEAKTHGIKRMVEGTFHAGMSCLLIEDIVSSGSSVIETALALRKEGLIVTDCISIVNRQQGAFENLKKMDILLHFLFDINDIFSQYCSVNKVDVAVVDRVKQYLHENRFLPVHITKSRLLPYSERAKKCIQPVAKRLFEIMEKKQTNLCVSADSTCSSDLLKLAKKLGPHICMLKTHIDIIEDFSEEVTVELRKLSELHEFLIFEDRKFADIGNTVMNQYKSGIFKIYEWADIVTVHGIPGDGIIKALKDVLISKQRACILIAEMSSKGALIDDNYKEKIIQMAESNSDFVIGYVCQQKLSAKEHFIHACPGVSIEHTDDSLGQQYKSPEDCIKNGIDVIIVGRGIYKSSNILSSAIEYKTRGYNAYLKLLTN